MSREFIDQVLQVARNRGIEAEVICVESEDTPVLFEANRLKSILRRQSTGCAVRVIVGSRVGLASTNRLADAEALVDTAIATAEFGAEAAFALPVNVSYPLVRTFDEAIPGVSVKEMIDHGNELIARLRDGHDDVRCEARIGTSVTETWLANTSGATGTYKRSTYSHNIEGVRIIGTDMLYIGDGEVNVGRPSKPLSVVETARQQLEWCRETVAAPGGLTPILFSPDGVAGVLLGPLTIALNGKMVNQGASPLVDKRDELVVDSRFSLIDDGTLSDRPGSQPLDDEGVRTRRNVLIDRGVVSQFYYDLQSAGKAGMASTGNGGRSIESLPTPSTHNLIVEPGSGSFEELLKRMGDGLVVEGVIGAEQGNVLGGDFGGNVILGYRVKNGQIVGRVKDTMISGNLYDVLNRVVSIGSDSRWVGGAVQTPSILLEGVSISSSSD